MERQILETVKKQITLRDKLHLMAETLRNCTDLHQGVYNFYAKHLDGTETFCAMGALGFKAGIPKGVLQTRPYELVLEKYGLTEDERRTIVQTPRLHKYANRTQSLEQAIWWMNDFGQSYNQIANWLDNQ